MGHVHELWLNGVTDPLLLLNTNGKPYRRNSRYHFQPPSMAPKVWSNNNNNIQDNVYGAVIMAEPLREFTQFIWWMQNGAKRPPTQDQARRLRLWVRLYRLLESTPTIAIYYYYQPENWYSFYRPTEGRRLSRPSWLVTYQTVYPVHRRSPIPVLTGSDGSATTLIEATRYH